MTGSATTRNDTGNAGLSIHYVECHDNYTLFDKLDISILIPGLKLGDKEDLPKWATYSELTPEQQEAIRAQDKLAAAFVLLAQGTPFMNGGQEFMRTKNGNENSYNEEAGDKDNAINLSFKTTYEDVYKVYKGLIALRKSYDAFTAGTEVEADTLSAGVTQYITSGTNGNFCVYFNATGSSVPIDTVGYSKVIDISNGTIEESTALPRKVHATSFVILKE